MKTNIFKIVVYLSLLVIGFFTVTSIQECNKPKETQKVDYVIPKQEGSFDVPTSVLPLLYIKDSIQYKDTVIYTDNPINKELAYKYEETRDTLEKYKLYLKAIEEIEQTSVFEDSIINLQVYTKTRGTLLNIKPKYTVKEKTIELQVPQKQSVLALYAGGELVGNQGSDKFGIKADIGIQNKKGTILSVGVDNNQNYYIGAKFRIINIKK